MSTEPDYTFNQPATSNSEGVSIHLPFALLTAAIAVIMVAQTVNIFKQRTALRDGKVQLVTLFENRKPLVEQSKKLQEQLQSLVMDLLLLAKTDDDAKAIIQKYNIQQAGTPSAPDASAPAPAAPK
jgi:hypothetical protein